MDSRGNYRDYAVPRILDSRLSCWPPLSLATLARSVTILVFALQVAVTPCLAREELVPRTIVALYDGANDEWRETLIHRMAEKPLNYLGLVVLPHDIREPLPNLVGRQDVRGILTWWQGSSIANVAEIVNWAAEAMDDGKRLVILGEIGLRDDEDLGGLAAGHLLASLLGRLGVRFRDGSYDTSFMARAVIKNSEMVEFERKLPTGLALYEAVQQIDPSVRVHLRAVLPGRATPADLVVTGPRGGYAASGYTHYLDSETGFRQWFLNPFAFFREAFGTDDLPKPDVTTAVGRRIYFSHIDGDGWRSISEVQPYRDKGGRAIDVLIEKVFAAYPDLPVTLAPISGDLDPEWCGDDAAREAAHRAFALPNVEPASHTHSHPLDWYYYRNGHPQGEEVGRTNCAGGSRHEIERAYLKLPFDLHLEFEGSVQRIREFLPPGRCVTLIQWSGDATPFPYAIAEAGKVGLKNINGGDARFDAKYPSVSWVPPIGRATSGGLQIYAAASNENTYTAEWSDVFYGFAHLPETLESTDKPRRLLPINLYYHSYSGEKLASLNALLKNLTYIEQQEIVPITTTAYIDIALGFYSTQIRKLDEATWRIEQRGSLNTVRFDDLPNAQVDWHRSVGVLGMRRHSDSLYIALDPTVAEPIVALTDGGNAAQNAAVLTRPYLVHSRWLVQDFRVSGDSFRFAATGFGPGEMVWVVPQPGFYLIVAFDGNQRHVQKVERESDGTIRFRIPAKGPGRASVRVVPRNSTDNDTLEASAEAAVEDPPLPLFLGQEQCSH